MPNARLQRAVTAASAGAANPEFAGPDTFARPAAPVALAVALVAACLYAAFAHGAVASADEERLQLALAVISLAGAVAWCRGRLSLRAPGRVWAALGLLAAFAFCSGVTVIWSVAPDRTWTECNRVMTYVLGDARACPRRGRAASRGRCSPAPRFSPSRGSWRSPSRRAD